MEPKLIQSQSQRLILSPQIRQYLRLLQLPINELEQAVEAEMTENPVLEERAPAASLEESSPEPESAVDNKSEVMPGLSMDGLEQLDENFRESMNYPDFSRANREDQQEKHQYQETLLTKPKALSDYLFWQLQFAELSEKQQKIASEIVGNIDDNGYLRADTEEIAKACHAEVPDVEAVLEKIQELDPPGIGARNLQETLTLQLKKKIEEIAQKNPGEDHTAHRLLLIETALKIVTHHLALLEKRDWHGISKALPADIEIVKKSGDIIAHLDPRPGRSFFNDDSHVVVPDAAIVFNDSEEEGKFKVEIHDEKIPEIRINPYYRKMLRTKGLDEKSKIFLKEKIQNALNFIQAIQLRRSTLRDITQEIVKAQPEFLEKGFLHLKPLRLKDIANNLGIHESTVSRAIQGKYVSTPQGVISYKSFFSTRMESSAGEAESQKSLMEKIRMLIDKEPSEKPYSDEQLVNMMKAEGIQIARRTVAKYRDLLKILPSHMRRRK